MNDLMYFAEFYEDNVHVGTRSLRPGLYRDPVENLNAARSEVRWLLALNHLPATALLYSQPKDCRSNVEFIEQISAPGAQPRLVPLFPEMRINCSNDRWPQTGGQA